MPPPQPREESSLKLFGFIDFWTVLCGLSAAVTKPFRYGEGIFGTNRHAVSAVLIIFFYAVFVPCPPLLIYGVLFIGIVILKRMVAAAYYRFAGHEPSFFTGYPLPCLIGLPFNACKRVVEPGLVAAFGWYLKQGNPPLGWFVIAGAVAAAYESFWEDLVEFNRDLAHRNRRIQMEYDARRRAKRGW